MARFSVLVAAVAGAFAFGQGGGVALWAIAGVTANKGLTNRYLH